MTGFEWFGDLVPFVVRALSDLGHSTTVVPTNRDVLIKRQSDLLRGLERFPAVGASVAGRLRTKAARQGEQHINDLFRREVERVKPDVVLSVLCWGEPLTSETLAHASAPVRIGWLMDDPFGYQDSRLENLLGAFDRLYSVDDGWSDNVERMTGRRPVWLPCGADPHSHGAVERSAIDPALAGHIVYVGSSCLGHPTGAYRRAMIECLDGLPLAIFGDDGWLRAGAGVARAYRGGPVSSEQANAIYASGAIALNIHHPQFRRGTSLRTFALCCSGAFQIADWRDGLECWLRPGVELETFRTPRELRALAERYLSDTQGRGEHCASRSGSRPRGTHVPSSRGGDACTCPVNSTNAVSMRRGSRRGRARRSSTACSWRPRSERIDRGADMLEFGAGAGSLVKMLRTAGFTGRITAADILPRPEDVDAGTSWVEGDLNEPLPLGDRAFDAIISTEVIEHLENPRATFREFGRLLRPGGVIILTTPNQESIRSLLSLLLRGHYVDFLDSSYPAHITPLVRLDLARLCSENGFEPPRFFYTDMGSLPGAPTISWQQVSAGLLRGRRFSDTIGMTSRKRR